MISLDTIWLTIGFVGQGLFSARFIAQWLASEKQRKSIIPLQFWYFSIIGGTTLLIYAIHQRDPVFILGQLFGVIVYARNLHFIFQERKQLRLNKSVAAP